MKTTYTFFEFIARMGSMLRWSLMRNVKQEDLKQHSYDVAVVSHALATIRNQILRTPDPLDPNLAATCALFHDAAEVFTGDIPTPIKHFGGGKVKEIAESLERLAVERLLASLPEELSPAYRKLFEIPEPYRKLIKAADRIAALRKCKEEIATGNDEFLPAAHRIESLLKETDLEEVRYYMEHFMPERPLSLDALIEGDGAWLLEG